MDVDKALAHKVDKTEGASEQFPTWIFTFWPYGQFRAVNYEREPFELVFLKIFFFV